MKLGNNHLEIIPTQCPYSFHLRFKLCDSVEKYTEREYPSQFVQSVKLALLQSGRHAFKL